MSEAFVALGANLGSPLRALAFARLRLAQLPRTTLLKCSGVYRTSPQEVSDNQPDYFNAACLLSTTLDPSSLLSHLLEIERAYGRTRTGWHAARSLDLDLIVFDDLEMSTTALTLPHPRAHARAFVLAPVVEIAPEVQIGRLGSAQGLLERVRDQHIRRITAL